MRNFNKEATSLKNKKYNYDFDGIVRKYMMVELKPFFAEGPALEIGCYKGDSTVELEKYFSDLTVIEASSDAMAVTQSRTRKNIKFINSTIEDFSTARKFNSVFLINTLEHLDDAVLALSKIKHLLSENGRLFIVVPNADAPSRQIAVFMGLIETRNSITKSEWAHGHRRTYSFDTLNFDIRTANLKTLHRGGLLFKGLANFQMDKALHANIIDEKYLDGIYELGKIYPSFCSSIYSICTL
ncbi:class I SAM-dependent methyltransferase [Actimicrobium antarcticum]|uniref:Class I SAM-dependent methyltransferase n=1 Tax=Actimicrobium antarcticum TaxID=1051899 RepID=A0ABP7SR17_9BURK